MTASRRKRLFIALALLALVFTLAGCRKQTVEEQFKTLTDALTESGYAYTLAPLAEEGRGEPVPIYDETVWYLVTLGEEELLVYFDSSNRAEHLARQFCGGVTDARVTAFGLRYIILYRGADEGVHALLDGLEKR